jgi:adenosylcobinamide-GDP ribazoletransferase
MNKLKLALSFLTTIPVTLTGTLQPGDLGRAAAWFPLVGLIIGLLVAGAHLGLASVFPAPLAAVLTVTLWAALTGGLHLDGLADCCDGLLASVSAERRLEIMKDPRLGTFGGAGLLLHLLLKISALLAVPVVLPPAPGFMPALLPLVLAPVLARWLILLVARQPMARPGGLGGDFSLGLNWRALAAAALLPLALVAFSGWRGLVAALAAHLIALGVIRLARARLNGVTGDVLGLTVELAEVGVLLVYAIR